MWPLTQRNPGSGNELLNTHVHSRFCASAQVPLSRGGRLSIHQLIPVVSTSSILAKKHAQSSRDRLLGAHPESPRIESGILFLTIPRDEKMDPTVLSQFFHVQTQTSPWNKEKTRDRSFTVVFKVHFLLFLLFLL